LDRASPGVQLILNSIIQHPNVGVMIPIPQYPLYTASISLFNGTAVKYYLNEEMEWGLSVLSIL
jgi:aspartate/methionine/tyrosine aminotransferase